MFFQSKNKESFCFDFRSINWSGKSCALKKHWTPLGTTIKDDEKEGTQRSISATKFFIEPFRPRDEKEKTSHLPPYILIFDRGLMRKWGFFSLKLCLTWENERKIYWNFLIWWSIIDEDEREEELLILLLFRRKSRHPNIEGDLPVLDPNGKRRLVLMCNENLTKGAWRSDHHPMKIGSNGEVVVKTIDFSRTSSTNWDDQEQWSGRMMRRNNNIWKTDR